MRILLIRHGDPDYEHDTLTEKGRREAELLAKRASSLAMGSCYQSPLGRAMDTAQPCLKATGKDAEVLEWLREFPAQLDLNKDPAVPGISGSKNGRRKVSDKECMGYGTGILDRA